MIAAPDTAALPPSCADLQARVQALAPHLLQDGTRFLTALTYLASYSRPSIDRIASLLGCDREFVARRARRWADQGLWNASDAPLEDLTAQRLSYLVDIGEGGFVPVPPPSEKIAAPAATPVPDSLPDAGVDGDVLLTGLWRSLGFLPAEEWDRMVA